jgi:LacI family transcriptional regulator
MASSIKDIAAAAGVSISTVSNVMNRRSNVGEKTRQLVIRLCEEMNYVPNGAGKRLKSKRSNTILFNFSDFDRSFYLKIIEGINDYAGSHGWDLMICTTKSCEKYMRNNLTDGCIILDNRMKNETLNRAASQNYPVVVLDRHISNPYIKSIMVNNYDPMKKMIEKIVAWGYRKFAFIAGPEHTNDTRERFQAFTDVLNGHDIPFHRENFFAGDYREKSGYQAVNILLLASELPEILVCANDNMALGAIRALRERGCRVPEDVSVTGFDNCEQAEAAGLTTITIPNYERGYIAARSLIESISEKGSFDPMKIATEIVWRKSVLARDNQNSDQLFQPRNFERNSL